MVEGLYTCVMWAFSPGSGNVIQGLVIHGND